MLLDGDFTKSYTHADNSLVVATDTIKNTVYALAKTSPHVASPENFGMELARHFLGTYSHVSTAKITVSKLKWTRIKFNNKEHPHSFVRDGDEVRFSTVEMRRGKVDDSSYRLKISSGIKGLLVLKTTGSGFSNFHRDRYTTLPETNDRIMSTIVDCEYDFGDLSLSDFTCTDFDTAYNQMLDIFMQRFANDFSASVQATIWDVCRQILDTNKAVQRVKMTLPNKHVFAVDMNRFGLKNEGKSATVFAPFDKPNGLISATVCRSKL